MPRPGTSTSDVEMHLEVANDVLHRSACSRFSFVCSSSDTSQGDDDKMKKTILEKRRYSPELDSIDAGHRVKKARLGASVGEVDAPINFDCSDHYEWPIDLGNQVVQAVMFISIICNVVFSMSKTTTDVLLRLIKCVVDATMRQTGSSSRPHPILEAIPKDSRTVHERYKLDGKTVVYAVCPRCHSTYKTSCEDEPLKVAYPLQCTNVTIPSGSVCNELLTYPVKVGRISTNKPIKPFLYHSIFDHIAYLASQPHLERALDKPCDDLKEGKTSSKHRGPFEAEFLKTFPGPQPNALFIDRGDELRLAFSLSVDFFNIEGLRTKGSSTSCGVISMVCLNLPEEIRYKSENFHIAGIIPGPREPQRADINPYLKPLIEEMIVLWRFGIRLSRTASSEHGRIARAAIITVVCDLPAARKVAGLHAVSSGKFPCSVCTCSKVDFGNSAGEFERRDLVTLRHEAERWRTAKSQAERVGIESEYSVRWSELWRLSYWDPTRQLVVDLMHCLLLGLVDNHFTSILSLTGEEAKSKSQSSPAFEFEFPKVPAKDEDPSHFAYEVLKMKDNHIKQVSRIHNLLVTPLYCTLEDSKLEVQWLNSQLKSMPKKALVFVWFTLGLDLERYSLEMASALSKDQLSNELVLWRILQPLRSSDSTMKFTTPELISHIRRVIESTTVPTWLTPVPKNFGAAAAGSLKADEWRTLSIIYLPLALISYSAYVSEHRSTLIVARVEEVIDNTMELVQAVTVLFKRSTSMERADAYDQHMKKYISNLQDVHKKARLVPNLHMSTHISDFLTLYGSAYSWWAFPFERLIGALQKYPKNHKFAQMESTVHRAFITGSKLKHWVARPDCSPAIRACQAVYDQVYGFSLQPKSDKKIPDDKEIFPAAQDPSRGLFRKRYTWKNVLYSTYESHHGNSQIMFVPDRSMVPVPAVIQFINVANSDVVFVVRHYQSRDNGVRDPFNKYPDFPAKVYSATLSEPEAIEPSMILCHFASFPINPTHVVVLSLSRD